MRFTQFTAKVAKLKKDFSLEMQQIDYEKQILKQLA
jgi:hypothetical protein